MGFFIDNHFLLQTETAKELYHDHAKNMPIVDYHNHLPPDEIAQDKTFQDLGEIWLAGDHYKWRAMRTMGVDEKYCTGNVSYYEKFKKWAEVVPHTMRNPLFHWTHLELKNYFGIEKLLKPETADEIFNETKEKLQSKDFSVVNLLKKMKVDTVCTTDDPADTLEHHEAIPKNDNITTQVFPTFRPDKAMAVDDPGTYNAYLDKLSKASGKDINTYNDLLDALKDRHDFFASKGCKLSDHGLTVIFATPHTENEVKNAFDKVRKGNKLDEETADKLKSAILYQCALLDYEKGWTQQYHLGAQRNNNTRMFNKLGADTGFDSMGDYQHAENMARFFDWLDSDGKLAKTVLYNLNPKDNHTFASMIGNFNDGSVKGKMQWGSAWWFNDTIDGMEAQINTLSNIGLLSSFIGMLTDSRSFLSFPRHEYFRRILCNLLGNDVEKGLLPKDMNHLGNMVENICFNNVKEYLGV